MDFYCNPAFSTGIQNPTMTYFFAPPITFQPDKTIDINGKIKRSIDAGIEGFRSDSLRLVYPELKNSFRKNRYWGEGLLSIPVAGVVFTLGFSKELSLDFQSLMTGAETTISTEVPLSDGTSTVVFNAFLDANLSFQFNLDKTTMGIAKVIRNQFALGFSLDRYGGRIETNGFADGVVMTPSHNPPSYGGFKYNPPTGGPGDKDVTDWIEKRANQLLVLCSMEKVVLYF
jgi:hypothetical protein